MSSYHKYARRKTPPKHLVKVHNRMEKTNYKKQLQRWKQNNDYEIIYQPLKNSAWWVRL